jgi:hypothetical protein
VAEIKTPTVVIHGGGVAVEHLTAAIGVGQTPMPDGTLGIALKIQFGAGVLGFLLDAKSAEDIGTMMVKLAKASGAGNGKGLLLPGQGQPPSAPSGPSGPKANGG